jgi:hypothetical protein
MAKFDSTIYLAQIGLKSLGYDFGPPPAKYGAIDGDKGTKTLAAIAAFEASRNDALKIAAPPAGALAGIPAAIVAVAMTRNGLKETSKNQGPGIADYWPATTYPDGYKNREPYCAAFGAWAVREACKGLEVPFSLPRSPAVRDWEAWAKANKGKGVELLDPKAPGFKIKAGDICLMRFDGGSGHLFISRGPESAGRSLTIEGNTDDALSREGDGTFAKVRSISSIYKVVRFTAA